jgi:hypothetical protein
MQLFDMQTKEKPGIKSRKSKYGLEKTGFRQAKKWRQTLQICRHFF